MNNLRVFIFLQKQNKKCGSKEVAKALGLSLRHAQYVLKKLHENGFIDCDNECPMGYKIKPCGILRHTF